MSEMAKVDLPLEEIRTYCAKQPILRLSEFAPEFEEWNRPDADIAMLVNYVPGSRVTYLDMAGHEIDLGAIIGKRISLFTSEELRRDFLREYVTSASLIYAKKF